MANSDTKFQFKANGWNEFNGRRLKSTQRTTIDPFKIATTQRTTTAREELVRTSILEYCRFSSEHIFLLDLSLDRPAISLLQSFMD